MSAVSSSSKKKQTRQQLCPNPTSLALVRGLSVRILLSPLCRASTLAREARIERAGLAEGGAELHACGAREGWENEIGWRWWWWRERTSACACAPSPSPSNVKAVGASAESNLIVEVEEQRVSSTCLLPPPATLHLPTPQGDETLQED